MNNFWVNFGVNIDPKPYFPIFLFLCVRLRLFIQTPHISRVYWTFRNQCYCDHVVIYSNWIMVPFYSPFYSLFIFFLFPILFSILFPFYFLFILIILSSSRIHKPLYNFSILYYSTFHSYFTFHLSISREIER